MNAWKELQEHLESGETVEAISFGEWGWDGYSEPKPDPVPREMRGKPLKPDIAEGLMSGWSFNGGYGSPQCYAVYVWTDRRVMWVTQYDGATNLDSAPRNPLDVMPDMPGG